MPDRWRAPVGSAYGHTPVHTFPSNTAASSGTLATPHIALLACGCTGQVLLLLSHQHAGLQSAPLPPADCHCRWNIDRHRANQPSCCKHPALIPALYREKWIHPCPKGPLLLVGHKEGTQTSACQHLAPKSTPPWVRLHSHRQHTPSSCIASTTVMNAHREAGPPAPTSTPPQLLLPMLLTCRQEGSHCHYTTKHFGWHHPSVCSKQWSRSTSVPPG